jgi:hypothetical protein
MTWAATVIGGSALLGYFGAQEQNAAAADAQRRSDAQAALDREQAKGLTLFGTQESARQFDERVRQASVASQIGNEQAANIQGRLDTMTAEDRARADQLLGQYGAAGDQATAAQSALLGLQGAEAQGQAYATIQESPGQRWLRQRQTKALLANQAAIGGLRGGNVRTALQEQAAGFAMQDVDNQFSRLSELAGRGAAARAAQANVARASVAQAGPGVSRTVLPGAPLRALDTSALDAITGGGPGSPGGGGDTTTAPPTRSRKRTTEVTTGDGRKVTLQGQWGTSDPDRLDKSGR